ncbi:MAG: VWA domain-containing protein [Thermoproteota archaeon]|nr:VWA domain-containing protein [Thermoproteota archaeon]
MSIESSLLLRNDVLLDIAGFLARRWTGNMHVRVLITDQKMPSTKPDRKQIYLPSPEIFSGTEFQRYRQWRTMLWYESMRLIYCSKVLSYDHVFGFLLNTLETKRSEILGLRLWNGMKKEVVFYEGISWFSRPLLNSLYGKQKVAEAFSQYFLSGSLKGELFGNDFAKVKRAEDFAMNILNEAITKNQGTGFIERRIPEILKILELNGLVSLPIIAPSSKVGFGRSIDKKNLLAEIEKFMKLRNLERDQETKSSKEILEGHEVVEEYRVLVEESRRSESRGKEGLENPGLSVPEDTNFDESKIYDQDLIQKTKAKFKQWKTGWIERHEENGEELDAETFLERLPKTFIADFKLSFRTKVAVILDHSSSIEEYEQDYKRATVALCEALQFLRIQFGVYAFSTESGQVKCWIIKPPGTPWTRTHARRLAQVKALGGTPLAEIYSLLEPVIRSFRPDIIATLTDGEPSDNDAVRHMVLLYRRMGIRMVALGLGRSLNEAVKISQNLQFLEYERSVAVSDLAAIPKKVLALMQI